MEANDLRIGNFITSDYDELSIVSKIESKEFNTYNGCEYERIICKRNNTSSDFIIVHDDNWKPIPLTEEWLLKFGFVKKEIGYSKLTSMEECFLISFGKHININGVKFNNEIKYVHQLQNLYFALTGEELKSRIIKIHDEHILGYKFNP